METDARRRRGHAVRPRLPLAVLRHRPGAHGGRARGRVHPHPREEDLEHEGPAPGARAGRAQRASRCSSSPRTSRARRWPRWSSTSSAARSTCCAVKAPGLRRSPQGDAQGHRRSSPAARSITEDLGLKLENVTLDGPRPRQAHHRRQGQHHDRRRRRQEGGHRGPRRSRSARRSRTPPATTTARSSRSASPSSSAASRSSRSARPPRPR